MTSLTDIVINHAHSCDRSTAALLKLNEIKDASSDNLKLSKIARLIKLLIDNQGGITIPIIDHSMSKKNLDQNNIIEFVKRFENCDLKIEGDDPLTIFKNLDDQENEYNNFAELKELYSAMLNDEDCTDERKYQVIKSFITNLLTENEDVSGSGRCDKDTIETAKTAKAKIDKTGFTPVNCVNGFVFFNDDDDSLILDTISNELDSELYSIFVSSKSPDEEEPKEEIAVTKKLSSSKTSTDSKKSTKSHDDIDFSDESLFKSSDSKKGSTYPERKPNQTEEEWMASMTYTQEKSYVWKNNLTPQEKQEKYSNQYNGEFNAYIAEKREERKKKYGQTTGRPTKSSESQSEKKIKSIKISTKEDDDEIAKYIDNMKSCSSSSTKFFLTKSGHITYPVKLNQKIINLSALTNELKTEFDIEGVSLRCYLSNKLPVPNVLVETDEEEDEDDEKPKKPARKVSKKTTTVKKAEPKKEEELVPGANFKYEIKKDGCLMYVTDVLFKDVITLDSSKFEKHVIKLNEDSDDSQTRKERNMAKSKIYDGIYNMTMFRWLMRCNEDFHSIILYKGSIISLGETYDNREINTKKDINKSNNNLRFYSDHLKTEFFKTKTLNSLKERKENVIKHIENVVKELNEEKDRSKSKSTKESVYLSHYKFILNRVKESDNIMRYQKM